MQKKSKIFFVEPRIFSPLLQKVYILAKLLKDFTSNLWFSFAFICVYVHFFFCFFVSHFHHIRHPIARRLPTLSRRGSACDATGRSCQPPHFPARTALYVEHYCMYALQQLAALPRPGGRHCPRPESRNCQGWTRWGGQDLWTNFNLDCFWGSGA